MSLEFGNSARRTQHRAFHMIIDTHTHLFPEEVRRNRQAFCRRDEGFRLLYEADKARLASPQDLLEMMDRFGIEYSVICGFPWEDPVLCREGNDYLLDCAREYGGRLIPFACLPLRSLRLAERELGRCLSQGMKGVGEMAFYRRGLSPREIQRFSSALGSLTGRRVPLLLHVSEPVGHEYPGKDLKSLQPVYHLLLALPGATIILAHWGGGFFFYELMPEVARAAAGRLYYDTAASPFLYQPRIYDLATQILGPGRILFGSDYPLIAPGRYFEEFAQSGISPQVQDRIKGLNARELLLGEEPQT